MNRSYYCPLSETHRSPGLQCLISWAQRIGSCWGSCLHLLGFDRVLNNPGWDCQWWAEASLAPERTISRRMPIRYFRTPPRTELVFGCSSYYYFPLNSISIFWTVVHCPYLSSAGPGAINPQHLIISLSLLLSSRAIRALIFSMTIFSTPLFFHLPSSQTMKSTPRFIIISSCPFFFCNCGWITRSSRPIPTELGNARGSALLKGPAGYPPRFSLFLQSGQKYLWHRTPLPNASGLSSICI